MAIVALSLFACPKILCYPIIVAMSRLQHRRVEREKATRAHKKKSTAVGTVHVYLRECYFMRPAHTKKHHSRNCTGMYAPVNSWRTHKKTETVGIVCIVDLSDEKGTPAATEKQADIHDYILK
jgi:hypothetical protein